MNRKLIFLSTTISVIVVAFFVITIAVPLIPVTEDFGSQTFIMDGWDDCVTTFVVKKGWTLAGSYTSSCEGGLEKFPIVKINAPDDTLVWEKSGGSLGEFAFVSDTGGSYRVHMRNQYGYEMTIILTAEQRGRVTLLRFLGG